MQESLDDSPFAIPEWVREHPLLKLRGIELEIVYKPVGLFLTPGPNVTVNEMLPSM